MASDTPRPSRTWPCEAGGVDGVTFNCDEQPGVPTSHDDERWAHAEFACRHSEDEFRRVNGLLYGAWAEINAGFFDGKLLEPHFAIDRTAARSLGHCERLTGYGGRLQITLNPGLAVRTNRAWVVNPLPAVGTERFLCDLVLRFTVQQYVREVEDADENGYRGFGPKFTAHANRIGGQLGLGPVVPRRRPSDPTAAEARGWPHCVRPARYYGDDITEAALELARGTTFTRGPGPSVPTEGVLAVILARLDRGEVEEVRGQIRRHLDWVQEYRERRWRPRRRAERGQEDVDGSALGDVSFDRAWLDWNNSTVPAIALGVHDAGSFWDLPILADALEDAGCCDGRILRHLRERMEHSRRCWVLRMILALARE